MSTLLIYGFCLVGALALFLLMQRGKDERRTVAARGLGALIGLGFVGGLVLAITDAAGGLSARPGLFFSLFALVSVVSATQMIITRRPVYAALHFVLVVIASAGLFLMLEAEFMAFALIIVYAGAILITYMFVLMLAQQAPDANNPDAQADYDRFPREPAAGAVVGFVLMAVLTQMIFDTEGGALQRQSSATPPQALVASWGRLEQMPRKLEEAVARLSPGATLVEPAEGEPSFDLVLGVRAVLDGPASYDRLVDGLPAGVTLERVDVPVTDEAGFTTTVAELMLDGTASGYDVAGVLAEPARVEDEAFEVLQAAGLPLAAVRDDVIVLSVGARVTVDVPADPTTEDGDAATGGGRTTLDLPADARPDNIQEVGLALITRFPASLEIAGVILLMAMFGAVILARRQIEIGEDEQRAAAGLRPLGHYDEGDDDADATSAPQGGTA